LAGAEGVSKLAEVDELRDLRFAHDELRAALDLLVLVGKTIGERVARIIGPFDDVDELLADEVEDRHCGLRRQSLRVWLPLQECFFSPASPLLISSWMRASGIAPGTVVPSAKTSVGVAVICRR